MRETIFLSLAFVGLTLTMLNDVKNEFFAFEAGRRVGVQGLTPESANMAHRNYYNDAWMRGWTFGSLEREAESGYEQD